MPQAPHRVRRIAAGLACIATAVMTWPKRLMIFACALTVAVGMTGLLGASAAYALGPGQVCVFNAPNAAFGNGHVGWAFEVGISGQWIFGATDDNAAGDPYVPPGAFNGAWVGSGSGAAARAAFRASPIGYTRYRCINTLTSAVGGAIQQANAAKGWGYTLFTNNCLDHAYRILSTYRGNVMPPPSTTIIPNDAFVGGLSAYGWGRIVPL
jgi:hypothetical protein